MTEVTDRNETRAAIAAGGWEIAWGDLVNEFDFGELIIAGVTGTVGVWVSAQINAQIQKFGQSFADISDDVVNQAIEFLKEAMKKRKLGERDFDGLGVKAGIATYHRHMVFKVGGVQVGSTPLPNNHQPYVGVRVIKPLPPKIPPPSGGLPTTLQKNLGDRIWLENLTMYEGDYLTSSNGLYQLILQGDGNLVMYGPEHSVIWHTHTNGIGFPPFRLVAQADRNVVLYHSPSSGTNIALWSTHTSVDPGRPGCFFVLQDDRNLVLYEPKAGGGYQPVWQSHTYIQ